MEVYSETEKHQLRIRDLKRTIKLTKDINSHFLKTLQGDLIIQVQNLQTPDFRKQELIRLIRSLLDLDPKPETPQRQSRFCNIF